MNDEFNPYAAPQTETPLQAALVDTDRPAIWRDGRRIVIPHGAQIPARCWRCNSPHVTVQRRCQLTWFHPSFLFLLLLGVVPLLLVALFVQNRATFTVSLCDEHGRRRRTHLLIAWSIGLAGVAAFFFGAIYLPHDAGPFVGVAVLLIITGSIYGGFMAGLASARKIDKQAAWVTGAGNPFRDSLPDVTGQTGVGLP
jgi:hypothetical protein